MRNSRGLLQFFSLTILGREWLDPKYDTSRTHDVLSQAWSIAFSPAMLAACCLSAVAIFDAVYPRRPGQYDRLWKATALKGLRERVASEAATAKETMWLQMQIVSYEVRSSHFSDA